MAKESLFFTSVDPTSLVTNKLESNLQEIITSEDRRCIAFIVVMCVLHDEILMEGSTAAWWLWPLLTLSLMLMVTVMMIAGADDVLSIVKTVTGAVKHSCARQRPDDDDCDTCSSCDQTHLLHQRESNLGQPELGQMETSIQLKFCKTSNQNFTDVKFCETSICLKFCKTSR
jgi:hypothetical protein